VRQQREDETVIVRFTRGQPESHGQSLRIDHCINFARQSASRFFNTIAGIRSRAMHAFILP
jgi:hypothetical protein